MAFKSLSFLKNFDDIEIKTVKLRRYIVLVKHFTHSLSKVIWFTVHSCEQTAKFWEGFLGYFCVLKFAYFDFASAVIWFVKCYLELSEII